MAVELLAKMAELNEKLGLKMAQLEVAWGAGCGVGSLGENLLRMENALFFFLRGVAFGGMEKDGGWFVLLGVGNERFPGLLGLFGASFMMFYNISLCCRGVYIILC